MGQNYPVETGVRALTAQQPPCQPRPVNISFLRSSYAAEAASSQTSPSCRRGLGRALPVLVGAALAVPFAGSLTAASAASCDAKIYTCVDYNIVVGPNARVQFAGSALQCIVYARADDTAVPSKIDCFIDGGHKGQIGAYHASLDDDDVATLDRTIATRESLPGGSTAQVWSSHSPEKKWRVRPSEFLGSPTRGVIIRLGHGFRLSHGGENVLGSSINCGYYKSVNPDNQGGVTACSYSDAFGVGHTIVAGNRNAKVETADENKVNSIDITRDHFS